MYERDRRDSRTAFLDHILRSRGMDKSDQTVDLELTELAGKFAASRGPLFQSRRAHPGAQSWPALCQRVRHAVEDADTVEHRRHRIDARLELVDDRAAR